MSLLEGTLPIVLLILGAAALVYLLVRRHWRWWIFAFASAVASVAASYGLAWASLHVFFWSADELPPVVVLSIACALWALILGWTTAFAGLRRPRPSSSSPRPPKPRRRIFGATAAMLVLAVAGLQVNAYYGEYPTVGSLLGMAPTVESGPLPARQHQTGALFMDSSVGSGWQAPSGLPAKGTVISAPIPGTLSGFKGRDALVYLPPAYSATKRPVLPVLVLVAGQPGSPQSWLRSTNLVYDLDEYASHHGGLAPLVVMPDPNGSDQANTMCLNSRLAQADTYMARDVPHWIKTHLDADTNPAHWAIGGFSYGATCSLQMVTRHPGQFRSFMAISPEREPALAAERSVTVDMAFNGDANEFNSMVPLTLLAEHRYPHSSGWFAAGSSDATYSANVKVLEAAAQKAGMSTQSASFPGGHSWAVANEALAPGLKFLYARLGLP